MKSLKTLKNLVAKDKTKDAISILIKATEGDIDLQNKAIKLSSRLTELSNNKLAHLIDEKSYSIEKANINNSVVFLIDEFAETPTYNEIPDKYFKSAKLVSNFKSLAIGLLFFLIGVALTHFLTTDSGNKQISSGLLKTVAKNQSLHLNQVQITSSNIEQLLFNFYSDDWIPLFTKEFIGTSRVIGLISEEESSDDLAKLIFEFSSTGASVTLEKFQTTLKYLHKARVKSNKEINEYYNQLIVAFQDNDMSLFDSLLNEQPKILDKLKGLEEQINELSKNKYNYLSKREFDKAIFELFDKNGWLQIED